jgi:hypothetical protein
MMQNSVARMLYDSLKRGDPLDADWFWEAGLASAKEGTPVDIIIWDAVRELLSQTEPQAANPAGGWQAAGALGSTTREWDHPEPDHHHEGSAPSDHKQVKDLVVAEHTGKWIGALERVDHSANGV